MADIKSNNKTSGLIQIADEVIAIIAGTAALEIEGVSGMVGNFAGGIIEKLGKKNLAKGVDINVEGNLVTIELSIIIKFGYKIQEVSAEVQKRVKTAIETMTGLSASAVNINVVGLDFEKEKTKIHSEAEME